MFPLALVAGLLALSAAPAAADPPPKLDVPEALDALTTQQVYVAPGATARLDMGAVRKVLAPDTKLLVGPYARGYAEPKGDKDYGEHFDVVYTPMQKWIKSHHVHLIYVEGVLVSLDGEVDEFPSTLTDLREMTAYEDVTGPVLGLIAYIDDHDANVPFPKYRVAPPSRQQVDALAGHLREHPVYNAPGRDDPVTWKPDDVAAAREAIGHDLRIAALPAVTPGDTFVDYAPALAKRFPDSVVMVIQGRWLDVLGPNQTILTSARDYAYGRYQHASFSQGTPMENRLVSVLDRVRLMQQKKPFGRPPPPPQPKPRPFDVRRTISDATPWALLGSAIVLSGAGLVLWRARTARDYADAKSALRKESARAIAGISVLGARILSAEESGETVNPAVAERHATARTLYDQARTAEAMSEVAKIVDEGLKMPLEAGAR
jgi:hypothetical protein